MPIRIISIVFAIFLVFVACNDKKKPSVLFELKESTGINFINKVVDTKDFNILTYRNFYNGGGVAIGDINNDGLADVFFTANMGSNKLYKNKGNWEFEDISEKTGFTDKQDWSTGVVMVDINADGWLDIYVCNAGYVNGNAPESKLYINNGVPAGNTTGEVSFTESAKAYGLSNSGGYATHAAFFDYDLDGDLDAFIINNSFIPVNTLNYANKRDMKASEWPVADFLKGGGDRLFRNDQGKFTDVSQDAGIHGSLISFGLGITIGDVNGDNYPDAYVSNDFFERDYLYINQKDGTFKDKLEESVNHISLSSMGADMADINNDGFVDVFTTDMLPDDDYRLKTTSSFDNIDVFRFKINQGFYHQYMQNTLQLNNGDGRFSEIGYYSGVAASDWSWGALMFDADNDGLTDIYVCNGIYHDVTDNDFVDFFANGIIQKMVMTGKKEQIDEIISKMPSVPILNKAFKNQGNLKFSDAGASWGFTRPSFSNGGAYGDLDNDGDLDLIISNINEESFVYQNNSRENARHNFIGVSLKGKGNNTFAIGSKIKVYADGKVYYRELQPSRGFQSSVDYKQLIGLGNATKPDSMLIVWPDRTVSKYLQPEMNKVHVLQQPATGDTVESLQPFSNPVLHELPVAFSKHQEDDYIDFYYERNLPELLSREGPKIAKADVNKDGLEDLYIGGAKGQAGQLYQQTNGGFIKRQLPVFDHYKEYEDVAVLFFDSDGDKDSDLFIGSGGNNLPPRSRQLQHRLFRNDGNGNFTIDSLAFPSNDMNISVAAAHDYDNDGDMDLFVGGRSVPYAYGVIPRSYLYQNDGKGHFKDVTDQMNKGLSRVGMVTGAVWADVTGDSQKELVVTGEWMTPKIFSFNGSVLVEIDNPVLSRMHGWWQTVAAADLNGDGKDDLVLGNIGENFSLRPDSSRPVKMWLNDFDQNGSIDQFRTILTDGKDIPIFVKKDVTEQFPALKKENLKNTDYARKTIQQIFNSKFIETASVREVNYTSSVIALSDGKGGFTIKKMPQKLQFSSVNAVCITDINSDGKLDIVAGGNKSNFPPQFGRLDASRGSILINTGNGEFEELLPDHSGLNLHGDVRDIQEVKGKSRRYLLATINDKMPVLYELTKEGGSTK
jgi:hypothetical protein